ncbi:MAG: multidrug transporter MatE [Peptococcaceae bacterium]|nr:multidrug transporter MatE [Peptococcaceae bacterium]
MDFITGDIKQLYRKFLTASMASAMVMSIYSFVDTIAVGQSEGPAGAAAMAVITPLYGVLIFLGILCGVGGSVLYGNARGEGKEEKANALFTAAAGLMLFLILLVWIVFTLFYQQIFTFFGADTELMPKVMEYARWLIWFLPVFILPTFISSFIRNDGAPGLAMAAVIIGGCVNIFGDWFFVFPLGMGMTGAAIATVLGTSVQVIIMCIHFFTKKCTLRIVKPNHVKPAICQTLGIGFGASVLDLGTVILSIIMNNQIMRYGDTNALAVYGVVATITSLFQALYCGVGQAIQPIVSANCGAMQTQRIKQVWRLSLTTVIVLGIGFTAIGELFPTQIVRLFMDVTPEVLTAAPGIIRPFFLLFLFLGITVLATYHLQSIMHGRMSMMIAVLRSVVISGLLIYILPLFMDILGVWVAIPISELVVAVIALYYIHTQE